MMSRMTSSRCVLGLPYSATSGMKAHTSVANTGCMRRRTPNHVSASRGGKGLVEKASTMVAVHKTTREEGVDATCSRQSKRS
jgi:hypothetical protein